MTASGTAAPACARCGGPLTRHGVWPIFVAPVVVGGACAVAGVAVRAALGPVAAWVVVTAAFVLLGLALGPMARRLLTERCARCRA